MITKEFVLNEGVLGEDVTISCPWGRGSFFRMLDLRETDPEKFDFCLGQHLEVAAWVFPIAIVATVVMIGCLMLWAHRNGAKNRLAFEKFTKVFDKDKA